MFGVGLSELVVLGVLAVLLLGPEKLPEVARQAGQTVRGVRRFTTVARDELRRELGPELADLELHDLDPRNLVRKEWETDV